MFSGQKDCLENLITVNGNRLQLELIKNFACEFGIDMKIFMFCIIWQFEINYIYSKLIIKHNYIPTIPNTKMFGKSYNEILKMPFDYFKIYAGTHRNVFLNDYDKNIIKNILEHKNKFSQCQFSYLHNVIGIKNFYINKNINSDPLGINENTNILCILQII